jgi:hypothetical protein
MPVSILYPSGIRRAGCESDRERRMKCVRLAATSSRIERLFPIPFSSL